MDDIALAAMLVADWEDDDGPESVAIEAPSQPVVLGTLPQAAQRIVLAILAAQRATEARAEGSSVSEEPLTPRQTALVSALIGADQSAKANRAVRAKDPRRVAQGRIGGLRLAATHDPRSYTASARRGFRQKFYDATPADLPEPERQRRAEAGMKAHMASLAYRSAKSRASRKAEGAAWAASVDDPEFQAEIKELRGGSD